MSRFAIRTVRKGRVKIDGAFYAPDELYNGELDGQRFAFGTYSPPSGIGREGKRFVSLWGTEEYFHHIGEEDYENYKPPNLIDGVFHWIWWTEVDLTNSEK